MATSFYSLASASFAHGLWSPVIVIRAVGYDRMVWALCESVQRAPSQPGTLFHLVLGVGFLFSSSFIFATHQQQLSLPLHPVLSLF